MRITRERALATALQIAAPLFLLLVAVGMIRNYSPVPFWDMWEGALEFYQRVQAGDWSRWWAQHNEHRIVLARLLFWADLAWFGGSMWFLLLFNFLLPLGAFFTFRALLRDRAAAVDWPQGTQLTTLFVLCVLFAWMQKENLTWTFQSQFFLAQWLPLLAFSLLYRATLTGPTQRRDFVLACVFGVLSIGTMASGIIALPLMIVYALVLRMGWKRVLALVSLCALALGAFFVDYRNTPGHGSLRDVITRSPLELAQYMLLYIGSPFAHLFGTRTIPLAQALALLLVALSVIRAVQCLRAPREHGLELALLAFVAYIGGTALGTGAGRLVFGIQQALAGRYTTPALMAWVALLIVYLPSVLRPLRLGRQWIVWLLLGLLLVLTLHQTRALRSSQFVLFDRNVAALALALRIHDAEQVSHVHFDLGLAMASTEEFVRRKWSVFGREPFRGAPAAIGQTPALPARACRAVLAQVFDLVEDHQWKRVSGSFAGERLRTADAALLVNAQGRVVGFTLASTTTRRHRADEALGPDARVFKGYVQAAHAYEPLRFATTTEGGCTAPLQAAPLQKGLGGDAAAGAYPRPPFTVRAARTRAPLVPLGAVVENQGWTGGDFDQTRVPGFLVIGSYVRGDADTGRITLRLKRGDSLHFRTGPGTEGQRYQIGDGSQFSGQLPVAHAWMALVFDNPDLPDQFTLTLRDDSPGWGEWTAIAVREPPQ